MDKYRHIAELIRGFQTKTQGFFIAKVVSVEDSTCTVEVDGLSIPNVRLKPTNYKNSSMIGNAETGFETVENNVIAIPSVGSSVMVASISGSYDNLCVLQADVIDKLEITCNGINLMRLISGFLQTLSGAQIITPNGTGTFSPDVLTSLKQIEKSFKEIFK